ncbi:MAG: O-antigen ligase family protein [Chloroflexota bacterium]
MVGALLAAFFATLPLANTLTIDIGFPLTIAHLVAVPLALAVGALLVRTGRRPALRPLAYFVPFALVYALSTLVNLGTDYGDVPFATGRLASDVRSLTKVVWLLGNLTIAAVVAAALGWAVLRRMAWVALVAGAAAASVYGLYQAIGQSHGLYVPLLPGTEFIPGSASFWIVPRAKSTFLEPSFFGAFLGVVLPFGIALLAGRSRVTVASFFATFLIIGGIIVTFSVAGYLAAVPGVIALLLLLPNPLRLRAVLRPLTATVLVVMLLVATMPDLVEAGVALIEKGATAGQMLGVPEETASVEPDDSDDTTSPRLTPVPTPDPAEEVTQRTARERVATSRAAITMFMAHPLLGVGPGNFGFAYSRYRQADVEAPDQLLIPNNIYAELLGETGILGFGTFLFAVTALGWSALRSWRSSDRSYGFAAAAIAALIAVVASLLTAPSFTILYQWAVIAIVAAVAKDAGGANGTVSGPTSDEGP